MKIEQIIERLLNVTQTTGGYKSECPICDKGNGKQHLSLTVRKTKDGKDYTSLKCWKGNCDGKDIMSAIGLTIADIYDNPTKADKPEKQKPVIVATYDYKDEAGNIVFQAVRFNPKDFRQKRKDENGKEVWNLQGVKLVPYNLPALIANRTDKDTVYICEGEKDCNNINSLGLVATCNPMGAGKWKSSFNEYLKGFPVVIIADKDEVGRKHAEHIASELSTVSSSVKIIEMPDVNGKINKDFSDWLDCKDAPEGLSDIVDKAELWKPTISALDESNCINDAQDLPNPTPPVKTEQVKEPVEIYYDMGKKEYLMFRLAMADIVLLWRKKDLMYALTPTRPCARILLPVLIYYSYLLV